jgi:hypothetical protein
LSIPFDPSIFRYMWHGVFEQRFWPGRGVYQGGGGGQLKSINRLAHYYSTVHFNVHTQRRLDSRPQSIMSIEHLIPRVASLTVDCRGVNISLTIKPIWKLSNDKSVRLRYFVKRNSMLLLYCCDHHYDLIVFYYIKFTFFKLHGTCCHFSFINNPSEERNCV